MKTTNFKSLNETFNRMDSNIAKAKEIKGETFKSYVDSFIKESKQIKEEFSFTTLKSAKQYLLNLIEQETLNKKALEIFSVIFKLEDKKIKIKKELITLQSFTGKNAKNAKIKANVLAFSDVVVLSRLVSTDNIKEINNLMSSENYVSDVLEFIDSLKVVKDTTKKVVNKELL